MSKNGEIVTFYSYKGGVGRSMALANVAVLLAQWGHRTLVVDWDLEAPGMQLYFAGESMGKEKLDLEQIQRRRGVLDLLLDVSDRKYESPQAMEWEDLPIMVRLPGSERTLDLITAGCGSAKAGSDYFQRLHKLDVGDFYRSKQGGHYIEELRDQWKEYYDYVLVDSRAGVTDIGGICSIQLPDSLILMFTANEQSCAGAIEMARRIEEARLAQPRFRLGLTIIPVLSRYDGKEQLEEGQQWLKRIPPMLTSIYDNWLHGGVHLEDALANTIIPYWPFYSFGEELAVLKETTVFPGSLRYSYETLAALIATDLEFTELLGGNRDQLVLKASGRLPPPQGPTHQLDESVIPERPYAPERKTTRVQVFLSYAEEDGPKARRLIQALERHNADVWYWQEMQHGSVRWIKETEQRINSADAFIALVSPHFWTSYWCREEYHIASRKEQLLTEGRADADFVKVVKLADFGVSPRLLGTRHMLDLTLEDYDHVATVLSEQIGHQKKTSREFQHALKTSDSPFTSTNWPAFVDRHAELELLTSNIANPGGNHFWSVIGAPGMGKSWLLRELPRKLSAEWGRVQYVDLQKEDSTLRSSGELLLLLLLGEEGDHIDETAYERIEDTISESNRLWLLMVDGAEWLEDEAARTFRSLVSRLHEDLAHVGINGVPLAVVVAGRNHSKSLRGVSPKPEFRLLELTPRRSLKFYSKSDIWCTL